LAHPGPTERLMAQTNEWASIVGSTTTLAAGDTFGVAAKNNAPGARDPAVSWIDSRGNLWLYGGETPDIEPRVTGMGQEAGLLPVYGIRGHSDVGNTQGGLCSAVSWMDIAGNLWLLAEQSVSRASQLQPSHGMSNSPLRAVIDIESRRARSSSAFFLVCSQPQARRRARRSARHEIL
jgi:hypothetical protein